MPEHIYDNLIKMSTAMIYTVDFQGDSTVTDNAFGKRLGFSDSNRTYMGR
jgi:hypothetical protein